MRIKNASGFLVSTAFCLAISSGLIANVLTDNLKGIHSANIVAEGGNILPDDALKNLVINKMRNLNIKQKYDSKGSDYTILVSIYKDIEGNPALLVGNLEIVTNIQA